MKNEPGDAGTRNHERTIELEKLLTKNIECSNIERERHWAKERDLEQHNSLLQAQVDKLQESLMAEWAKVRILKDELAKIPHHEFCGFEDEKDWVYCVCQHRDVREVLAKLNQPTFQVTQPINQVNGGTNGEK